MTTSHRTRTNCILYRVAGALFALVAGVKAMSAYWSRSDSSAFEIAQAITYISLCVVFMALGRIKARKAEHQNDTNPPKR